MTDTTDVRIALLRHTLATLAYRGGKSIRDAPESFAGYQATPGSRTPAQILAHVGDLLDWARGLVEGRHEWHDSTPLAWDAESERFFAGLRALDLRLACPLPASFSPERLFQGPIADALTHVGQIAMLRRMSGAPMKSENYYKATISAGAVGPDQAKPKVEFD
jgi:hypothetical protein